MVELLDSGEERVEIDVQYRATDPIRALCSFAHHEGKVTPPRQNLSQCSAAATYNGQTFPLASSLGVLMQIGAHISVAKGYAAALDYAQSVGCECIQLFAKSPRQWSARALDGAAVRAFRGQREQVQFGPVFTHSAYLINLTTDNAELLERSIVALADELCRGAALGADGVVTHLGNDPLGDSDAAAARCAEAIARAFALAGKDCTDIRLLLENTAGAGRTFGGSIEQLSSVIAHCAMPAHRLGLCFDTCHGFAFGYELDTSEGWEELLTAIDDRVGLDRLGLVHANDCMFDRGSRRDRHAWIGQGMIGEDGFAAMLCCLLGTNVPVVTEMPGEIPAKDEVNIAVLKRLRDSCASSQ